MLNVPVQIKKRMVRDRKVAVTVIMLIVAFLVSWMPYATVSMSIAIFQVKVSPMMATLPAMFTKSSLLWTPLFFLFSNSQFRKRLQSYLK
jgi:hypothetical protein